MKIYNLRKKEKIWKKMMKDSKYLKKIGKLYN